MKQLVSSRLLAEVLQSEQVNNQVGSLPVKEGQELPNSVTEDVGGFSLMPTYSAKQIRRMHRLGFEKSQFGSKTKSAKKGWRRVGKW